MGLCIDVGDANIFQPWTGEELQGTMCPIDSVYNNVPGHMKALCEQALVHYKPSHERQQVTHLLFKYAYVFEHEIPTVPDAQPIRHAPYRVCPEKEVKISRKLPY